MKKMQFIVLTLLLLLLIVACAPTAAPTPYIPAAAPLPQVPAPAAAAPRAPAKPAWEAEWQKTLEAAKKEGKVSIALSTGGANVRVALAQGFKEAYGISSESVTAAGSEVPRRIISERRAGLYNYDISMSGATSALTMLKPAGAFDPLDPALILPDVTDPELIRKVWWQERLSWLDANHTYLSTALRVNYSIAINTNLVKPNQIKSYKDLLDPKWKGKMAFFDPSSGGTGMNFVTFADAVLRWDYLVELAKTPQPSIMKDHRLMLDWLAHGKIAIVVAPENTMLLVLREVGAPLQGLIPAEGTWQVGAESNVSMFNKAPHPNAAKVFINWITSKEGQKLLIVPLGAQSLRLDVPTNHLMPEQLRQPGLQYLLVEDEKLILARSELQKKATELFGPLMK